MNLWHSCHSWLFITIESSKRFTSSAPSWQCLKPRFPSQYPSYSWNPFLDLRSLLWSEEDLFPTASSWPVWCRQANDVTFRCHGMPYDHVVSQIPGGWERTTWTLVLWGLCCTGLTDLGIQKWSWNSLCSPWSCFSGPGSHMFVNSNWYSAIPGLGLFYS